jgi:hypothetical protein
MAARMPTAKAVGLTRHQRAGKLDKAHGRYCSRAVRRREGDTSRRYLAPTTWTPLAQNAAAYTSQITRNNSHLRGMRGVREGRAKAAIDGSRNGSTGSAIMAQFLAAANTAFAELRAKHVEPAKKALTEARQRFQQGKQDEGYQKYQEIVQSYYASPLYRNVKKWLEERK